jgi:excisionase family DNA binding protein
MDTTVRKLLVSKKKAADVLDICVRKVEGLIASKELASIRIGRRRLIPVSALEQFAKKDHATEKLPARTKSPIAEASAAVGNGAEGETPDF